MSSSAVLTSIRRLRGLLAAQRGQEDSDEQLLHAFLSRRDDSAFAVLVRRHGSMVLHVCRRVLGHQQDAEDAFQATFLVLARNAAALRKKTALASFLHGTAYRMAMKTKQAAARRRKHEGQAPTRPPADPADDLSWREVRTLLDEEIARLPDKYRSVFILCCLENLSRAEAARRLGLKERTALSRLAESRKRLQKQLARRGVELTVLLAATAVTTETASALPPVLMAKTIGGAVLPAVAALADSVPTIFGAGKIKLAMALVLAASVLTGAGLWAYHSPAAPPAQPAEPSAARASDKPKATPPQREAVKTVEIQGCVFGPDGKPKAGAKLLLLTKEGKTAALGVTAEDGRFAVTVPKKLKDHYLVAQSDGTGIDFLDLDSRKSGKPIELRLVKDNVIRGRIVNTEGKPVRGVRVAAGEIATYLNNSLDSFMAAWMNLFVAGGRGLGTQKQLWFGAGALFTATTDADGRFTLHGIGGERTVRLHFRSGGIADTSAWVVNRAGFDPKPYNQVNMDRDGKRSVNWRWWILSGPDFAVVAEAEKVIRGVVKDADTGKGRPGLEVLLTRYKDEPLQDTPKGKTDAKGCYEIHGARKAKSYLIVVPCDPATATMTSQVWADDTPGYRPITADLKVKKGVIVTGKVIDRTTGEALHGSVMAAVLRGNPFVKDYPPFAPLFMAQCDSYSLTDASGSFRLVLIPGPVLLMGRGVSRSGILYKWAGADPKYPQYFSEGGNHFYGHNLMAPLQGHCKVLEIKPGVAEVKQDIVLERQKALTVVKIQDAEGKPLSGVEVWGVANGRKMWIPYGLLESDSCSIYGEATDKPQFLVLYQPDKKLAGTLTLKGDEKQPMVVKLRPAGAIKGRLLDSEGKPLAGITIDLRYRDDAAEEIHQRIHEGKEIVSDAKGAFAFGDVIPEWKFELSFRHGRRNFERATKPAKAMIEVKASESRDLGAIKLKLVPETAGE